MRSPARTAAAALCLATISCLAAPAEAERACELRGARVDLGVVTVSSGGGAPFDVFVRGVGVIATLTASGKTRVTVRGGIVFRGIAKALHLRLPNPMALDGPLRLAEATTLVHPRLGPAGAVLFDVPLARDVRVVAVAKACRELELAHRPAEIEASAPLPDGPEKVPPELRNPTITKQHHE